MSTNEKIIFFGTPAVAATTLRSLLDAGRQVLAVVTNPDRPVGRGMKLKSSPVKELAQAAGLPILQPESARSPELAEELERYEADLFVVVAYGKFLPKRLLALPRLAPLNLHFSLLSKYRGAAPVNHALINGETRSGVTVQRMVKRMDAGEIVVQHEVEVAPEETAPALFERLTALGCSALSEAIDLFSTGRAELRPQNEDEASFAPLLSREDGRLDFTRPAQELYNRWRGLLGRSGVHCELDGERLKVHQCELATPTEGVELSVEPGTVVEITAAGWLVVCGAGTLLRITELQAPNQNQKRLPAEVFANGRRLTAPFGLG